MLALAGKCEEVQEVSRSRLQCGTTKLLPKIPQNINLQLEPNTKSSSRSIPDVDSQRKPGKITGTPQQEIHPHHIPDCYRYRHDQSDRAGYPYGRSTNCIEALHCTAEVL